MRISDWSSDVCSSDLPNQQYVVSSQVNGKGATLKGVELAAQIPFSAFVSDGVISHFGVLANATFISSDADYTVQGPAVADRKSVVSGTRVSVRVDLGGRRIIKKKNKNNNKKEE